VKLTDGKWRCAAHGRGLKRAIASAALLGVINQSAAAVTKTAPLPDRTQLPVWARETALPTKRALIIGIDQYQHAPKLPTPTFDARLMADALKATDPNFIVHLVPIENTTRTGLLNELRSFAASIQPGEVVLLFYSGHGFERGNVNYLIPAEAGSPEKGREGFQYLSLDYIVQTLQTGQPGITVIILDACRADPFDNDKSRVNDDTELDPPFATSDSEAQKHTAPDKAPPPTKSPEPIASAPAAGVSAVNPSGLIPFNAPDGFLVAYASEPGKVSYSMFKGDKPELGSIFTRSLTPLLKTEKQPVDRVFAKAQGDVSRLTKRRQQPFMNSFAAGEILLMKNEWLEANEEETWIRLILETPEGNLPSMLRGFLDQYPAGVHALAARKRIAELELTRPTKPTVAVVESPPIDVTLAGALRMAGFNTSASNIAVTNRDLNVRATPQPGSSKVIATLSRSSTLQVLSERVRPGWAKVALSDGTIGYIGSVETPRETAINSRFSLVLTGDDLPAENDDRIPITWWQALKDPSVEVLISGGSAKTLNRWTGKQIALLRALRVRSVLIAQGASLNKIRLRIDESNQSLDQTTVTFSRAVKP
jgi:hypothetical protein